MIILSSPSGAGKTTLVKLLSERKGLITSISHTTRKPRSNEVNGKDYHFVTNDVFKKMINKQEFLEYAKVFNNFYGTTKSTIFAQLNKGKNVIFDIDWQGTKQLSKFKNLNLLKIYLITDSKKELKKRLISRKQNSNQEIQKRFNSFDEDIKHWKDYEYIVINKNLDVCFKQIENIIQSHKNNHLQFS